MTAQTPPVDILAGITPALEPTFRLDQLVALSPERALYKAWDRSLKRSVALRLHLVPGSPGREWFVRETETLAALDHPAIRHVYALGEVEPFAYRTANWIDGESLADAIRRGARPIPAAMSVVRDLLGALEHAHAHGIIIRRIAPTTLMLDLAGRAIITDLRFSSWCLAHAPADLGPGAGRRRRAGGGDRRGRIRARVPRARPGAGTGGGDQGAAPVADGGSRRRRAVPTRGAARGTPAPPQHREHLRHRGTGRSAMVHNGARPRRQPRPYHRGARPLAGGPRRPAPRRSALGA